MTTPTSKTKSPAMVVHRPRQYTISELLEMRYKLPVVCCPIRKFGVAAWDYGILRVRPATRKVLPLRPPPLPAPQSWTCLGRRF